MKFGVCAILKNENLYLREWTEHYINLGFDKIILYDNNDINGEVPNVVIQDYIDAGIVTIIDRKIVVGNIYEKNQVQIDSYNECLEKYKDELDWIAFLDIDEFLELEKHTKIQYLFDEYNAIYNKFDVIILSWYTMCGKNELYYRNEKVQKRFTEHSSCYYAGIENIDKFIKPFVKTSSNTRFNTTLHCVKSENIGTANGLICYGNNEVSVIHKPIHDIMYVKHYYTKSLTEFLYKLFNKAMINVNRSIETYKALNGWSEEHEKVYQNFLKQNNIEL